MTRSENHRVLPSPASVALVASVWTALVATLLLTVLHDGPGRSAPDAGGEAGRDVPSAADRESAFPLTWTYASMWRMGLFGIAVGTRQIRTRFRERLRVEETLRINEARLDALLHLHHHSGDPRAEITRFALDQSVQLTESQLGYLAFYQRK